MLPQTTAVCSVKGCRGFFPRDPLLLFQAKIKTETKRVEDEFLEEISGFNRDFSLGGAEEELSGCSRKQSETQELGRMVETLRRGAQTLL